MLVSSAEYEIQPWKVWHITQVHDYNKHNGPKIEPWGTPHLIYLEELNEEKIIAFKTATATYEKMRKQRKVSERMRLIDCSSEEWKSPISWSTV